MCPNNNHISVRRSGVNLPVKTSDKEKKDSAMNVGWQGNTHTPGENRDMPEVLD